jgi:LDH2 family malate/lactate/ureidoglycolate dehydrogenase
VSGERILAVAELKQLAKRALLAGGLGAEDANAVVEVLVLADLFGIHTHGVRRIGEYLQRVRLGGMSADAVVTVDRVAPAVARVDGANGLGPLVGMRSLDAALAGARAAGIGLALARGSNHFGPAMPYCFLAARQGFASIVASNATTTIAPWGGTAARLGNNPIGFGAPRPGGDPLIIDIAMSVVARAKIRSAEQRGEAIPPTWATDATGHPTTDPRAALAGLLLPIAGHKGYGLAVMIDMFAGLLSGASYLDRVSSWSTDPGRAQDLGHLFIVFDTAVLADERTLHDRIEDFIATLHVTPAADPARPVLVPGEPEMANYHRQLRDGVTLAAADLDALVALAGAADPS